MGDVWEIYNVDDTIADHRDPAKRLCMITSGCVSVFAIQRATNKLPFKRRIFKTLRAGESFGQYTLIRDRSWGAEDRMLCEYVAAELTEIRSISVDVFEQALKLFPEFDTEFQILEDHHASTRYPQYLLDDSALQVSRWARLMQAITDREKAFWSRFRNGLALQHSKHGSSRALPSGLAVAGSVKGGFDAQPPTPHDATPVFCALSLPAGQLSLPALLIEAQQPDASITDGGFMSQ